MPFRASYAGSDEYEDLVFNAIVIVLGIVHDRRFNLEPLVDQYARSKVFHTFVTSCLMQSYGRLLANPTDSATSRQLRATFKVGKLIMKFLVHAREKQKAKEESIGIKDRTQFSKEMKVLFTSLETPHAEPIPRAHRHQNSLGSEFPFLASRARGLHASDGHFQAGGELP